MIKIALIFYGCRNLGDDLFVYIFSQYFSDCKIRLFCHPHYCPPGLGKNVKILPFSYWQIVGNGVKKRIFKNNKRVTEIVDNFFEHWKELICKSSDAYVRIGGSIYKECCEDRIEFRTECSPNYSLNSRLQNKGNYFLIGANLGPVCTEGYWERIRKEFEKYNHVCLRDYASYLKMKELSYVQYAPDVVFMLPKPQVTNVEGKVVISVVDISLHTKDLMLIEKYYNFLVQTINALVDRGLSVTLMSFCKFEGDEKAINYLLEMLPDKKMVTTFGYNDNMREALEVIAEASYIIGTRFHSVILALDFDKPFFPIVYNCKTENYLRDIGFKGKYARLNQLENISVEETLYNYDNNIIVDCSAHKQYAKNQFWGLQSFLESKKQG